MFDIKVMCDYGQIFSENYYGRGISIIVLVFLISYWFFDVHEGLYTQDTLFNEGFHSHFAAIVLTLSIKIGCLPKLLANYNDDDN